MRQVFTHLQYLAGPCSCDRSTGAPNRARDQSACCVRFVSFKGGCFTASFASGFRGTIRMIDRAHRDQDTERSWKDEREEDETKIEKNKWGTPEMSLKSVTGAVAGGRLACTLRRDARRRSISRPPFSSSSSLPILPLSARIMQPTAYPATNHPSN